LAFGECRNLISVTFAQGSAISSGNFGDRVFYEGHAINSGGNNLRTAYLANGGGAGTYTRAGSSATVWTKN